MPDIGPLPRLGTAYSRKSQNAEIILPMQTTESLINACKIEDVTVTSAVHAAYVMAIIKHADPKSKLSQTTFKKTSGNLELKGHVTRVLCNAIKDPEFLASPMSKDALVSSSLVIVERYFRDLTAVLHRSSYGTSSLEWMSLWA
ncbi:hypothetical protein V1511DRAFT_510824 [Dipodascopsis uninucleata]